MLSVQVICEAFTHGQRWFAGRKSLMLIHCVVTQAVLEAVKVGDTQICMLTPAVLRQEGRQGSQALRSCRHS